MPMKNEGRGLSLMLAFCLGGFTVSANAQEARRRWERLCQIRQDKFDWILPEAMRENGIDMWITVMKEGLRDPLYHDFGEGYVGSIGYYIFTDRGGDRIERAAIGVSGRRLEACETYDIVGSDIDLNAFVVERDPARIGLNMSKNIGAADGLSHQSFQHLVETLGESYASRFVSAEKLVSDFRSRRVASEIVAFGEAGEISREIAERALSNEIITPAVTALEDVSWWMQDQLLARGLESSFGMPSVYVTGPEGIVATSNERIIQRGDLLMIDWGVGYLNFFTDMKRIAYVLKEGETGAPPGIQHAFDRALAVREVLRHNIKPGPTAGVMLEHLNQKLAEAGFELIEFNRPSDTDKTDVIIGCHSVGNLGHGVGPSIAWFNPTRLGFEIRPTNMFSIELFAYTAAPEFGGKKVRIPLEDDAIVTERGVEWFYPVNERILLIR
ncbi:MAG TPA: M24 family metallopeptidase [Vicinamibacteria bacterium]|nr:M24 family metallopeptidase [Vicinamibacteria bacterium]